MAARRGFTIIELVVAIIIAAIISGAVASSLSQLGRARDASRIRMTASRRATDALENIRRDVQSVLRSDDLFDTRLRLAPEVTRTPMGELDRDQLLMFATRLRPIRSIDYSGEGEEYETQYRIEDDRDGSALWRRRDAVPDEYEDAGGIAEPVGDGVIAVRFEAYDGSSWVQEWDSDIDGLPISIRATVTASGVRPGEDAYEDPRAITVMRTEIPIDRVAAPKLDEATLAANAAAEAAAQGGGAGGTDAVGGGASTGGTSSGGSGAGMINSGMNPSGGGRIPTGGGGQGTGGNRGKMPPGGPSTGGRGGPPPSGGGNRPGGPS
ncbi:MAG: prepilin-type N-terminal cleavage/methylation domain-containing protein [Planctomycetes bacterium]|nr:prepilin-type N-terminal cleavage/methylation domain-containing protein [Planctomycetota bacterium]